MPSVVVLFVPGRAGAAAVKAARDLAEREQVSITLVAEAPQAAAGARCGGSALEYNRAVADQVWRELDAARQGLEGHTVEIRLLIEGVDPSFHELVAAGDADHVLVPAPGRWSLRRRGARAARRDGAAAAR